MLLVLSTFPGTQPAPRLVIPPSSPMGPGAARLAPSASPFSQVGCQGEQVPALATQSQGP